MNIDERLEALTQSVELIAGLQRDNEKHMTRMIKTMARLETIVIEHEYRIEDLEGGGE